MILERLPVAPIGGGFKSDEVTRESIYRHTAARSMFYFPRNWGWRFSKNALIPS